MRIERATEKHKEKILWLLLAMYEETGKCAINVEKVNTRIATLIATGWVIIAVDDEDEIVGSIGLGIYSEWYSKEELLADYWTFVHPKARNTRAFVLMIRAVTELADKLKMPFVTAVKAEKDTDRKNKLFGRYLNPAGQIFEYGG